MTNARLTLAQRIAEALPCVLVGGRLGATGDLFVLEVDCDHPGPPLSLLVDLCERVETVLGDFASEVDTAVANPSVWGGLRRRLVGGGDRPMYPGRLVGTLNRLRQRPASAVVVFHDFQLADRESIELVRSVLSERQWLKVAAVFEVDDPPSASVEPFLTTVRELYGDSAVISGLETAQERLGFQISSLPRDVRRVLRAGAHLGDEFESVPVSAMLDESELSVLDALQDAVDAGLPVRDRGRGRFLLAPGFGDRLRASTTPSLALAWRRALAAALGIDAIAPMEDVAPPEPNETVPLPNLAEMLDRRGELAEQLADAVPDSEPQPRDAGKQPAPATAADKHSPDPILRDIGRQLDLADRAAQQGAIDSAVSILERVGQVLDRSPDSHERSRLLARALLLEGHIHWRVIGAPEAGGDLESAKQALEQSVELADAAGDVMLGADARATLAAVCFDLGDAESLEVALRELTLASHMLTEAGHPTEAACLLNDQAAIWMRIGDPVRAYHLLSRSREVFSRAPAEDTVARVELAETDHWTARLVLHSTIRPGREKDAVRVGLDHANRAAATYKQLSDPLMQARVWETMARLEHKAGRIEEASAILRRAITLQQRLADAVGLARSTALYADLLLARSDAPGALAVLESSIDWNLAKGSPLGLAFNARALDQFEDADPAVQARARELKEIVAQELEAFGPLRLPDPMAPVEPPAV